MPGAYAHITLVNLLREPARLEVVPGFPEEAIAAILEYFQFTELGAVSPDYPYLAIGDGDAAKWADEMHYTNTGAMIRTGIDLVREMDEDSRRKSLAWLLGYAAHVVTDVTVHPVVELKVGRYDENKTAHRVCEMHQDAHIFQRLNVGEIGLAEHLDTGIARCCEQGDRKRLDGTIAVLWEEMLRRVHPEQYAANRPDIEKWHRCFVGVVDTIAEEGQRLLPLSRHVATGLGLTYPARDKIKKREYIDKLQVPHPSSSAEFLKYDAVFDHAVSNVLNIWTLVASGIFTPDNRYVVEIGEWNLDTGRDQAGRLVFWS